MTPEENSPKRRTFTELSQQFLLGIVFGVLLALIPLAYLSISTLEMNLLYVELMAAMVLTCGILAALLGKKFLRPLIAFLESIPPIG
ncbi:MAG TPA: hypothetical protein IGS53_15240 [Leptolyngbyaceae cyanobacterium M33_DOE_097]|uniref:Uncharacterized protein n=1 Tax=Oscillatoriales cyanobacterium SpSt-418 TaxID=2282169 RepID=A0A7C3KBD4_9CYAN|nr:hypothetical protein [Leptolyngbyaceae cyanobacterium M33_DOE_097]